MRNPAKFGFVLSFATVLAAAAGGADAQQFPVKPIRIVVPNSPGSIQDTSSRLIAPYLGKNLGQAIVIENKPSTNSLLGYEYVAKQVPADGYTIACVLVPELAILPLVVKNLRFDPLKDLPPLIGYGEANLVLGTSPRRPWKTFGEIVAFGRANPGKLNYGASSPNFRLLAEAVVSGLGMEVVHVPYTGGGSYFKGLLSGDVDFGFLPESIASSFGDKFRVLATTRKRRQGPFADVPTFGEVGLANIPNNGYSFNVPVGVPRPVLDRLFIGISQTLKQPEVRASLEKLQLDLQEQSPEVAAASLAEKAALYAELAKKINLKAE